jgi:hypothetical protein
VKKTKLSAMGAWKLLLLSLPKGIAAFVTVVAGLSVSLPLSAFLVGLPLLAETLVLCSSMLAAERVAVGNWKRGDEKEDTKTQNGMRRWEGWRALLAVLFRRHSYRGILYALLQLPIGIAAFVIALVLPVTAWAVMLSPLAYQVSSRMFSFNLFEGNLLMDRLLPSFTSYEISWVYGGAGVLLVLFLPPVLRTLGRLYAAWILAAAGPERQDAVAAIPAPADLQSERLLPEPQWNS